MMNVTQVQRAALLLERLRDVRDAHKRLKEHPGAGVCIMAFETATREIKAFCPPDRGLVYLDMEERALLEELGQLGVDVA
jgi:hypothetical protein